MQFSEHWGFPPISAKNKPLVAITDKANGILTMLTELVGESFSTR